MSEKDQSAARPLFLGLILGEVFAVIIWSMVPVVLMLTGSDPAQMVWR